MRCWLGDIAECLPAACVGGRVQRDLHFLRQVWISCAPRLVRLGARNSPLLFVGAGLKYMVAATARVSSAQSRQYCTWLRAAHHVLAMRATDEMFPRVTFAHAHRRRRYPST